MTTLRNAVFQVHWLFGITAGLVLAIVGVTGGVLSFEDELLKALNPGVLTVEARGPALSPSELLARVREQEPNRAIASLQLSSDPRDAAVVGFAPPPGERRGARRNVDPYSGALLGEPRYQGFFRTTMQLHRWLVADEVGKQVVGASTAILVFFCLSGLVPALATTPGQPARVVHPGLAPEGTQFPLAPARDRGHLGVAGLPGDGAHRAVVVLRLVPGGGERLGRRWRPRRTGGIPRADPHWSRAAGGCRCGLAGVRRPRAGVEHRDPGAARR